MTNGHKPTTREERERWEILIRDAQFLDMNNECPAFGASKREAMSRLIADLERALTKDENREGQEIEANLYLKNKIDIQREMYELVIDEYTEMLDKVTRATGAEDYDEAVHIVEESHVCTCKAAATGQRMPSGEISIAEEDRWMDDGGAVPTMGGGYVQEPVHCSP